MPRILVVLLAAALVTACGGSEGSGRGPTSPTSSGAATSTAAEDELLYGCIELAAAARPVVITSAGTKLDAAVFGEGPVGVVLAHDRLGSLCDWATIAPELADRGYRVLIFDYGAQTTFVRDMRAATRRISDLGAKRIVLGGESLGGTVALVTAAAEQDVAGAFSLSAPSVFGDVDGLPAVRRIRAPVLFVAAKQDGFLAEEARLLYRASASREKELLIVPGSEHGRALYDSPAGDQVRGAVDRLLEKAAS